MKNKITILEETYFELSQSACFRKIFKLNDFKIKVEIKRNTYDMQSYAIAYVYSPTEMKWNSVYSIPYTNMLSLKVDAYSKAELQKPLFVADVKTIEKQVELILL